MSVPKHQQKPEGGDTVSLMELLIQKDGEIKEILKLGEARVDQCAVVVLMHLQKLLDS